MSLVIEHVSKRYGAHQALNDLSLRLETGVVGLVGPNGAGKTTLMRMVGTLIPPTTGRIAWRGLDTRREGPALRRVLGYLPQDFGVYPELTVRQFLRYLAAMKGLPRSVARRRADELLETVSLQGDADRRVGALSGGMKQRIGIAQALLNDPELLIVDEPTAGLDPAERVRFRTLLAGLVTDRLVLLSTHIIGDVEAVAGRLLLLQRGRLVADCSAQELVARATSRVWTVTCDAATATSLQATHTVTGLVSQGGQVTVRIIGADRPHRSAQPADATLEDAYLSVVESDVPLPAEARSTLPTTGDSSS